MKLAFTVPGPPVPKARPRVMPAGYSFTPKRTRDYEKAVAEAARAALDELDAWASDAPVKVRVAVYRARNAGDIDNFAKSATDGMATAGVYDNDRQIVELHALLLLDREDPRMLVEVETVGA